MKTERNEKVKMQVFLHEFCKVRQNEKNIS